MKKIITVALLISYFNIIPSPNNEHPLTALEGTWYVNMSNFNMWLKGNKRNPRFTYTLQTKRRITGLKDVVSYNKRKKQKTIKGFDTPVNNSTVAFVWRGKGLLSVVKSKWEILYQTNDWALIHFQKTVFTTEGYDVISRQKSMDEKKMTSIKLKLTELGIKANLQSIEQN